MSSVAAKYGMIQIVPPPGPSGAGLANGSVTTDPATARFSVDSPMVWLVGIGAATLGLIAASTSIRVGKFRASAQI